MAAKTSASRSGSTGPWFLHIEGLPGRYTWQDLKDLIRTQASHGIWAEMEANPSDRTVNKGYARVQREDEARVVYGFLTKNIIDNARLRVHLWDISGTGARFDSCNCSEVSARRSHSSQSHPSQLGEVSRVLNKSGYQFQPSAAPVAPLQASFSAMSLSPQYTTASVPSLGPISTTRTNGAQQYSTARSGAADPRYLATPTYYAPYSTATRPQYAPVQPAPQSASYRMASDGTPINGVNGFVKVEARGVFVSGLNYKAGRKDVKEVFSRAGDVVSCEVPKSSSTGRSKGNAMVQFASAAQAQRAVEMFNRKIYMGMELKVRLDKEATAISPPALQHSRTNEPVIVNGSQVRT